MALVDTGAEVTILQENPSHHKTEAIRVEGFPAIACRVQSVILVAWSKIKARGPGDYKVTTT